MERDNRIKSIKHTACFHPCLTIYLPPALMAISPSPHKTPTNTRDNSTYKSTTQSPQPTTTKSLASPLTHNTPSPNTSKTRDKASRTLNIVQAITALRWGQHKETLLHTYKTITILEYASTIWSPTISLTNTDKLQIIQNKIATRCTQDTRTPIQHHDETSILPIKEHLQLHATQLLHTL